MSSARRVLIAANWKMNGTLATGKALAESVVERTAASVAAGIEVLICPPATLFLPVGECLSGSGIGLGAQDCHAAASGAHTGDIAAPMLRDAGCGYVIVGHSERRSGHHETSDVVRAKAGAALAAGLTALVCVGETGSERDAGHAHDVVGLQVEASLPAGSTALTVAVAYEPVWAIGTGKVAHPDDIADMHRHIRKILAARFAGGADTRILYGGSVKAGNASEVLALADVDGALVGGASLNAEEFAAIVAAAPLRGV